MHGHSQAQMPIGALRHRIVLALLNTGAGALRHRGLHRLSGAKQAFLIVLLFTSLSCRASADLSMGSRGYNLKFEGGHLQMDEGG